MSYYEYLNEKSALCKEKADLLHDEGLVQFYENASQGFKQRADRLTLKEAEGTKEDYEEEQKRQQEEASKIKRGRSLDDIQKEAMSMQMG